MKNKWWKFISGRIYHIIKDLLIAIFGGFVGALLGLYAVGNQQIGQVVFLVVFYAICIFFLIVILDFFTQD